MESQLLTVAEVAEKLQYKNPQTVRRLVESGKLKAVGTRKLMRISQEALDDYIKGNPVALPESSLEGGDADISDGAKVQIQAEDDKAALATHQAARIKAETATIAAGIARDEATQKRDLPETLAKREVAIKEREDACVVRGNGIKEKEINQSNRGIVLDARQQDIEQKIGQANIYYQQKVKEADAYASSLKAETDADCKQMIGDAQAIVEKFVDEAGEQANAKQFEINNLNIDAENAKSKIAGMSAEIDEAQQKLDAIAIQIKAYLPQVIKQATVHCNTARRTSGQVSAYHDNKANKGWDLETEIRKFIKDLEKELRL